MELDNKNVKKILLIITFTIVLFVFAQNLNFVFIGFRKVIGVFYPVITGLCIAFVLNVLLSALENYVFAFMGKSKHKFVRKARRPLCLTLCMLITFGLLFVLMMVIIPDLVEMCRGLAKSVPRFLKNTMNWAEGLLAQFNIESDFLPNYTIDWDNFFNKIIEFLTNDSTDLVGGAVNATTTIVSGVTNAVFSTIIAIYFMAQKERIRDFTVKAINAFIPEKTANRIYRFSSLAYSSFSNFISGQLAEALILGVLCFIGMLILRIPNAGIISIIIGITAIVPIVGAFVGEATGTLLLLVDNPMKALVFLIFILVLQQVEGSLIYPKVMGKSVGLPGIIVFSAVLVGGNIAGVSGALLAVPIASVLYTLIKAAIDKYPLKNLTHGKNKSEAPAAKKPSASE